MPSVDPPASGCASIAFFLYASRMERSVREAPACVGRSSNLSAPCRVMVDSKVSNDVTRRLRLKRFTKRRIKVGMRSSTLPAANGSSRTAAATITCSNFGDCTDQSAQTSCIDWFTWLQVKVRPSLPSNWGQISRAIQSITASRTVAPGMDPYKLVQ